MFSLYFFCYFNWRHILEVVVEYFGDDFFFCLSDVNYCNAWVFREVLEEGWDLDLKGKAFIVLNCHINACKHYHVYLFQGYFPFDPDYLVKVPHGKKFGRILCVQLI